MKHTTDQVTVVVPVLNEAGNINELTDRVLRTCQNSSLGVEILFVDGGSTDGTQERVQAREKDAPVRLLVQDCNFRGLAGAVVLGARYANSSVIVVMDGDLSHPPEMVPWLAAPLLNGTHDMVIGSRYIHQGRITGWSWPRKAISFLVTMLTRLLIDVRDPMAGFFAVKRDRLIDSTSDVNGYKIGFEILANANEKLRTLELPIEFIERQNGRSKATIKVGFEFLNQWAKLAGGRFVSSTAFVMGTIIDILVFLAMFQFNFGLNKSQLAGISAGWVAQFVFRAKESPTVDLLCVFRSAMLFPLALFLQSGMLASMTTCWGWPPLLAITVAAFAASAAIEIGHSFFVFVDPLKSISGARRWRIAAVGLFAYIVLLRLTYMGLMNLNPQEAYYWNYSQHLDLSYLDHPPMTAWLIAAGTKLFGNCEFGVRAGGFLCWIATICFGSSLTKNMYGKDAAFRSIVVLCITPFFLSFFITPDAPLTACWAATLYFLERALLGHRRTAFWSIGLCMGLGMLSKYTIALLGLGAVTFLIFDKPSRRWVKAIDVALVPVLALFLFAPVIIWNAKHHWASFHFQGTRRLSAHPRFSLPALSAGILLLMTPTVLLGVLLAMFPRKPMNVYDPAEQRSRSAWLFGVVFTLVPASVFIVFSLMHPTKPEWTGPIWLAALPAIAKNILPSTLRENMSWPFKLNFRLWKPTAWSLSLIAGGLLYYVSIGYPGLGYGVRHLPIGWDELGKKVERIEDELESATGQEPIVVGVDQYYIASEIAFYRSKAQANDGNSAEEAVGQTTSWQIFGQDGLMYGYWFNSDTIGNRPIILIGFNTGELNRPQILQHFQQVDPVIKLETFRDMRLTHQFYYRICHGYSASPVLTENSAKIVHAAFDEYCESQISVFNDW